MTALAQLATGFPKNRVMGQAGMLDTARFTNFVAEELGVPVGVGADADPRLARRHDGAGALALHRRRQAAVRRAGRRTGSTSWSTAPATAAPRSWRCSRPGRPTTRRRPPPPAWRRPCMEDSGAVMPVCAWVDGEYGITGVYLGVEAEIGREGVRQVVEGDLTDERAGRRCARPPRPCAPSRPTSPTSEPRPAQTLQRGTI